MTIRFADVVLDYYDSGNGPISGPFGGNSLNTAPESVSTDVVLGNNPNNFLSLPNGSFVTVGFTDEQLINRDGDDLLINEIDTNGEVAEIYVSSNLIDFQLLGIADGSASFDLEDIDFQTPVQAVKIVGKDLFGNSPGFDLASIEVLSPIPVVAERNITFSEYPIETENPRYLFSDNQVTVLGSIYTDTSQPESPVIAANSNYIGPVFINFENPVSYVSLDAGYFDDLNSTTIEYIGQGGNVLHSETNADFGVLNYRYENPNGIVSVNIVNTGADQSGFSVDTINFGEAVSQTDTVATFSVQSSQVVSYEGNQGSTQFAFNVTRSGDLSSPASVGWAVTSSGENAASATDFTSADYPSGSVSFAAGQRTATVYVDVQGDREEESNESFVFNLIAPSSGNAIGTSSVQATIMNDDDLDVVIELPPEYGPEDDVFVVQHTGILSLGAGDDTYVLAPPTLSSNANITVSDTSGINKLQFIEGFEVTQAQVAANAVQFTAANNTVITILGASNFEFVMGGNPLTATPGQLYDFNSFAENVLNVQIPASGSASSDGFTVAEDDIQNTQILLGDTQTYTGIDNEADVFVLDVEQAQTLAADTQTTLDNFDVTQDSLQVNTDVAIAGSYTLQDLADNSDVTAQYDPFANQIIANFGPDLDGTPITVTFTGINDTNLIDVTVV